MCNHKTAIGGEFTLGSEDFVPEHNRNALAWPEYSGKKTLRCDSGRGAIFLLLEHWQNKIGRVPDIWLPSFLCSSVIETVRKCGLQARFYQDGPGEALSFVAPTPTDNDLVLVVHYFGHTNRRALNWLAGISSRRWGVVEDCVQSPYSGGVGITGEYAITSLRKWWPAPDGATLHFQGEDWTPSLLDPDEHFISRRLIAKLLRSQRGKAEEQHLKLLVESESLLDSSVSARTVSWVSQTLLDCADLSSMCLRRRRNWINLAESLSELDGSVGAMQCMYTSLSADAIPLAFPLRISPHLRDELRNYLASQRIYCPVHWVIGDNMGYSTAELSQSTLSLPVDQRYDQDDMHTIARLIADYFK